MSPLPDAEPPRSPDRLVDPFLAVALVLVIVTVASIPALSLGDYTATVIGGCFLVATWWLVLRHDERTVRAYGLSLGGLLEPPGEPSGGEPPPRLDLRRLARESLVAAGWALAFMLVTFPPFVLGYYYYWRPHMPPHAPFALRLPPSILSYVAGQLVVIALPEEAFFRGYLQTALDRLWPPRARVLGADIGPGLIVASAVFAAGHVLTIRHPARLAVFFPALVFGWLRRRTGGIGASVLFHASCNVFSETLGRSFGLIR